MIIIKVRKISMEESQGRGRPKKKWVNVIKEDMNEC